MEPAKKPLLQVLMTKNATSKNRAIMAPADTKNAKIMKIENPDEMIDLRIDRRTLPKRIGFQAAVRETHQKIDILTSRFVTKHRARLSHCSIAMKNVAGKPWIRSMSLLNFSAS
jgi:hypothetical protein